MENELKRLLFKLCESNGTPGDETYAAKTAVEELSKYARTHVDKMGNVIAEMGNLQAKDNILLEAHLDQIGLIVTGIDKNGFLHIDRCGGIDFRVLPGSAVTVYGKETLHGVVCCTPPHLSDGEDKVEPTDKMAVDIGLSKKEAEKIVSPGDRARFCCSPKSLLGTRISAAGLDNRAGVASLIRCAQLLDKASLKCKLTILCSTREETGGQGAVTGAFSLNPTQAVCVDVGFADQPDVTPDKCCKLGGGAMIGFAPILNRETGERLVNIAEKNKIPYKRDVMGGSTGTNSDEIAVTKAGVPMAMVSIPLRYMHTPAEVIDLCDVENTARLLAEYIKGVG